MENLLTVVPPRMKSEKMRRLRAGHDMLTSRDDNIAHNLPTYPLEADPPFFL